MIILGAFSVKQKKTVDMININRCSILNTLKIVMTFLCERRNE